MIAPDTTHSTPPCALPHASTRTLKQRHPIRSRREKAGQVSEQKLLSALDALSDACQVFRDKKWDQKTGSWHPHHHHSSASDSISTSGGVGEAVRAAAASVEDWGVWLRRSWEEWWGGGPGGWEEWWDDE